MMGSMFGAPKQPAPPPPPPPSTLRDEVNGVEQVPVTNADGSVTYVTRAIPLTAEQQAAKAEMDAILAESLTEIKKLSASDYSNDAATQKVLDQWEQTRVKLLGEQERVRSGREEEELARRGLSDSSAAQAVRRQRLLDSQDAEENLKLAKDELGNQIRGERLALQQNLYNIASNSNDNAAAKVQQAALRGQGEVAAINAQRQASLLDYYGGGRSGANPFMSSLGSGLGGALGRGIGTSLGGPIGGEFGSYAGMMLGSLFGGR